MSYRSETRPDKDYAVLRSQQRPRHMHLHPSLHVRQAITASQAEDHES